MDDDTYKRLFEINTRLIELCGWLNEKQDFDTASRLIPITDDLTSLMVDISMQRG